AGLWALRLGPAIAILFLGFLLTGFGSAYYHLDPDDSTLFWDRLPMAVSFMAILAIGIEERVDAKAGTILLLPLIGLCLFSLFGVGVDHTWHVQPVSLAVDWRPAALRLGAVLPVPGTAAALPTFSGKIYRYILLAHCRGVLRTGEVV